MIGRRKKKRVWRIGVLLGLFTLLLLFFLPGHGIMHYRKLEKQSDALTRENQQLRKKNKELARKIDALKNDTDTIERVAREKYGLLKKNEEVYKFKQ